MRISLAALLVLIKRRFSSESFVSTGRIQRYFQVDYATARYILDRLIEDEFCEPQVGAWPCKIIKYQN